MSVTQILRPAAHKTVLAERQIDSAYKKLRLQVFLGIFIGYAGYYLLRKNFSMVMPDLIQRGYSKADLGVALSSISIAYGISKL
jgi:OPA family glycerol-3-phosphate transporter-like MFS transporter